MKHAQSPNRRERVIVGPDAQRVNIDIRIELHDATLYLTAVRGNAQSFRNVRVACKRNGLYRANLVALFIANGDTNRRILGQRRIRQCIAKGQGGRGVDFIRQNQVRTAAGEKRNRGFLTGRLVRKNSRPPDGLAAASYRMIPVTRPGSLTAAESRCSIRRSVAVKRCAQLEHR